ncbi:MAG: HAD family hydrolase [Acidobacteriota bacterium]
MKNDGIRSRLQAILFDFDGTLIDASEVICHSFNHALRTSGQPVVPLEFIRHGIGRPLREIFLECVSPELLETVIAAYREEFSRLSIEGSRLIPGVDSLVPRLAEFHALGIVTSRTSSSVHSLLRHFELDRFFGSVVGVGEVSKYKPAPEPVWKALEELGADSSRAAMVGDTVHDIQAARAAGVLAIGVATGAHSPADLRAAGAARVLESVADLPRFLEDPRTARP